MEAGPNELHMATDGVAGCGVAVIQVRRFGFPASDGTAATSQVLSAGDNEVGLEQLEEDADDIALQKARRSAGSMSMMSGANRRVYMEYSTGKKLHGQMKSKPKDPAKRHHLFKKRFG
ncbi:General transcription and DNA repair factor IIH helicase subunit xpb1 [Orobanche hederae]